ncbi:PREDICTED: ral guanine nucleotide dissociation stimulator-like [Ceratotherium simum simum]|uniref:Ral guanine nucleotide dissociation stimulator-like n=1 Tax=Ceratotherium simum simum TaxID=73337 RepID=A0ABM1C6A8_CERSS|nr:PREDICTED: ral guanine nucleotide dissociation stimulator-like [Ceratotherium simum simum]
MYVQVDLPGSDLDCRDPLILVKLELLEATEAEPEVPAPGLQPTAEPEQWPVVEVELAPAPLISPPLVLEPASPPSAVLELEQGPTSALAGMAAAELESPGPSFLVGIPSPSPKIETEPAPAPEPSCPKAVASKNHPSEKKPNLMAFPSKLVAEQLTVMDAVSSWALRVEWGRPSFCHHCPRPDPDSCDLGPNPSPTPYQLYDLGNYLTPKPLLSTCRP